MTLHQELASRLRDGSSSSEDGEDGDPWESAPAPAVVAKRLLEGLFQQEVPAERIGLLTSVVHWGYGTLLGGVYGLVQGTLRARPLLVGPAFGAGVWAASYVQLVPMGLYEPPWAYPVGTLANDLGYHLTYGAGVAAAFEALARPNTSVRG